MTMDDAKQRPRWWHEAVGYEVYLRSFSDSDGDGVGDLAGIRSKLPYLSELGIDLLWITPFYPSPMVDLGYDVADFRGVDPVYGDLDDLDELIADAHDRGIRVVIDLVPNHTSARHPWFEQARRGRDDPHRDYYIWADPGAGGGPPNNWVSYFGGPAWSYDEASGQYYLHLFLPEQPDLNWRNPKVSDEFERILSFWLDRGIDGFRIDVAQAMVKDERLRSNPEVSPWDPTASRWDQWESFEHLYDLEQPETLDVIFRRWREIADERGALLLGETYVADAPALGRILRGDGLHTGFWFQPMHIEWKPAAVREVLEAPVAAVADPRDIAWVASSHDEVRSASRFGIGDRGRARSLAFTTLLMGLPGLPFLYQGEELGLREGEVAPDRLVDPIHTDTTVNRDGCRTPMPWEVGVSFGFSTSSETWLPDGGRVETDTASWQRSQPDSWFHRYRRLVETRRTTSELHDAPVEWLNSDDRIVAFRRGEVVVMANLSDHSIETGQTGELLYSSSESGAHEGSKLAPDEAVIMRSCA